MKQITLDQYSGDASSTGACPGRLFVLWGGYGAAMAWLWTAAGGSDAAHAVVWAIALAAGAALALRLHEGEKA